MNKSGFRHNLTWISGLAGVLERYTLTPKLIYLNNDLFVDCD